MTATIRQARRLFREEHGGGTFRDNPDVPAPDDRHMTARAEQAAA